MMATTHAMMMKTAMTTITATTQMTRRKRKKKRPKRHCHVSWAIDKFFFSHIFLQCRTTTATRMTTTMEMITKFPNQAGEHRRVE